MVAGRDGNAAHDERALCETGIGFPACGNVDIAHHDHGAVLALDGSIAGVCKNREAEHLPAWRAFNQAVGTNGSVGVWHESYLASPGSYENIYVNMPPFGLGRAGTLYEAAGKMHSAAERLRASISSEPE